MKYLLKKPDTFLSTLNDDINAILQKSFDNMFPESIFHKELNGMAMPVDVKEYDNHYCVKIELPGINKEDINVGDIKFDSKDVVRHPLVSKIIHAYENYEK